MNQIVTILRPPANHGTRGELRGTPQVVLNGWPCSIETLSGREQELANSTFAAATHRVEGYGPIPLGEADYLDWTDPLGNKRQLNIGAIIDKKQNGVELQLLCEEVKD